MRFGWKSLIWLVLIVCSVSLQPAAADEPDQFHAMLTTYCFTCHSTRAKIGGLALDSLDLGAAADDARTWEKALRKLRGHLMPPPGNPQPPQKDVDSFVAWMENTLDSQPGPKRSEGRLRAHPTPEPHRVRRIGESFGGCGGQSEGRPAAGYPGRGLRQHCGRFERLPAFLDQYITAARHVAKLAIGDPAGHVSNVKYSIAANQNSDEPLPPGTRGGVRFKHNFPADGEYRINIDDLSLGLYTSTVENESTLVIMIDGKIVFRKPIGGPADLALADRKAADGRAAIMDRFSKIPVQMQAGVHDVVVAFIDRAHVESDENVAARLQRHRRPRLRRWQ